MEQNSHSETELVLLFRPIKWVASTFITTINKPTTIIVKETCIGMLDFRYKN